MKLLFDATTLSYFNENNGHRAGLFTVALNLLQEFEKQKVEITLYCDFSRYYFLKNIPELRKYEILEEYSNINKFIGKIIYMSRNLPLIFRYFLNIIARFYRNKLHCTNLKNLEQLRLFDVYFSPFDAPSEDIIKSNIIKFRMIHDIIPILEKGLTRGHKEWWQWHNKIYSTINDMDYYVTNSKYTQNDVLKYFPFIKDNHIKTTLLAANQNFIQTGEKPNIDSKYIFSLCTLGKRKNLIFAIKNFYEFINKNKIDDLKLVLAGGIWTKFEKELYSAIGDFDKSKIELLGYVPDEDLPKLYSNALMFIYPSLYEGFGLPVLEAMQCGCPVITSNTSSLPEVIGEAGIQIDPTSDEEMIQAYERMYFDTIFRKLCSEKGLERAKNFSWEKCAKEILDFIRQNQPYK